MSLVGAIAIYFIIWWLVLFTVLPWGATSAHETGAEVGPGHAPSAPLKPMLVRKMAVTTVLAGIVFALFYWLKASGWLELGDLALLT